MRRGWAVLGTIVATGAGAGCGPTGGSRPLGACTEGDARCGADGHRETCGAHGDWALSDFVCTVNVSIDDSFGTVCATKADGRYRCWSESPVPALPVGDYRRVQAHGQSVAGLTRDGQIVSTLLTTPLVAPPAVEMRTTNMWGSYALCYRTDPNGALTVHQVRPDLDPPPMDAVYEGPFRQVACAFEGLACGVRGDSTMWCNHPSVPVLSGDGWTQIAIGARINCGARDDGSVACGPGMWSRYRCTYPWTDIAPDLCVTIDTFEQPIPMFPRNRYAQVAVTNQVACALSTDGQLLCLSADGGTVTTPPGRYSLLDASLNIVCAIRSDGTTGCWRHEGAADNYEYSNPRQFQPYAPAIDADW